MLHNRLTDRTVDKLNNKNNTNNRLMRRFTSQTNQTTDGAKQQCDSYYGKFQEQKTANRSIGKHKDQRNRKPSQNN